MYKLQLAQNLNLYITYMNMPTKITEFYFPKCIVIRRGHTKTHRREFINLAGILNSITLCAEN